MKIITLLIFGILPILSYSQDIDKQYYKIDPIIKGASFHIVNGELNLFFREKYTPSNNEMFTCKIYGVDNNELTSLSFTKALGDNYIEIDLSSTTGLQLEAKHRIELTTINKETITAYIVPHE